MAELPRSYLFVPGDRPERFDKALASGCDCVILDLEDAVLPEAKGFARRAVRDWLETGRQAAVRVNGIGTEWHADDIDLAAVKGINAIILPKAEQPDAILPLALVLPANVQLIPIIESASGLLNAPAIADLPKVQRLAFGSVDYANDVGQSAEDDEAMYYARSRIIVASSNAGIGGPIDGVTLALSDERRLDADVSLAKRLGMTGKLCIHPRQIPRVNAGFLPTPQEIEAARRIIAAADASEGKGTIRLDNKMIDRPVVDRAKQLIARAEMGNQA